MPRMMPRSRSCDPSYPQSGCTPCARAPNYIIPGTVAHRLQAPSPSGHGLRVPRASVSSQIPGFPARALAWVVRPRHVWGAARCAPHPSFPVRVRTYPLPHPPALCPEDLSIWRNGSSVLASPAMAPARVPGPYPAALRLCWSAGCRRAYCALRWLSASASLACGLCCFHVVAACYLETFRCLTS